jgi:hypothetical protein
MTPNIVTIHNQTIYVEGDQFDYHHIINYCLKSFGLDCSNFEIVRL